MRGVAVAMAGLAAAAGVAVPLASGAVRQDTAVDVTANGNVLTGLLDPTSLNFAPRTVDAVVGQTVRWTNTDFLVPHTATEDHGLFDLAGTYGGTPANPPGFGPGATVALVATAGTFHYYCRVHPVQMHGVISAPVTLSVQRTPAKATVATTKHKPKSKSKRRHTKPKVKPKPKSKPPVGVYQSRITATWATAAPAPNEVFDVRYRSGSGNWQTLMEGTTALYAGFGGGPAGTVWQVEARLRSTVDSAAVSDWSPVASTSS